MQTKKCSYCHQEKSLDEFPKHQDTKDKHYAYCKKCHCKIMTKQYGYHTESRQKYVNSIKGKFAFLRGRAKKIKIEFGLSLIDFAYLISSPCCYCGKLQEDFNGVDRVDSKKGYIKENSVSCCAMCNYMKRDNSVNEFKNHVEEIHNWQKEESI